MGMSTNGVNKEIFPDLPKPALAVDTVIIRVKDVNRTGINRSLRKCMQVLLIEDNNGKWMLPGSMLRLGETDEDALNRIKKDKVKCSAESNIYFEQLYTIANTPYRDDRGHVIPIVYIGATHNIELESDSKAKWFWVAFNENGDTVLKSVDSESVISCKDEMYYDHFNIIMDTLERIKGKLRYSDIGFEFVDSTFTIVELEYVFEALNRDVIPGFRRIIKEKIEETGEMCNVNMRRPSRICKKKEN